MSEELGTEIFTISVDCPDEVNQLEVVEYIRKGQYDRVITHDTVEKIIGFRPLSTTEEWGGAIQNNVTAYVDDGGDTPLQRQIEVLAVAVASLQLFTQINWVGPPVDCDNSRLLPQLDRHPEGVGRDYFMRSLSVDGESVYNLVKHPELLALAKLILQDCWDSLTLVQESRLWCLRSLRIHQELLEDRSPTLKKYIIELVEQVCGRESLMTSEKYRDLAIQIHLEVAHLMYFYYEPTLAEQHTTAAIKLASLDIQLTGALGKRTRFQQKDISQLLLQVKRTTPSTVEETPAVDPSSLPTNVAMDDDTVLNAVQFTDQSDQQVVRVTDVEQALILTMLQHHRKTHEGIGDILKEESLAYVNYVLSQPQCWSIQTSALLMRTLWESDSTRRMSRSLSQLEELVNQYKRSDPEARHRMHLIHSVQLPPRWDIEKQLGQFLLKIGSTNGALEVFLRLQIWEEVIKCYASLGRSEKLKNSIYMGCLGACSRGQEQNKRRNYYHNLFRFRFFKAENVIREQLSLNETPTLYCYLGDVTNDPQYYIKAWELSKCRNARSQKMLGYYYLRKLEFATSLPHFEKSLQINSLQIGVWFSYGCAALACSNFTLAAKAFHRCVTLESNNFEAWSNLATAYVRSNQKPRAFAALTEALKCEYENWRLWENCILIGSDIGEFTDVIRAYHRLLDLKDKYTDTQVLEILVKAINNDLLDAKGSPCAQLRPKLQELFGRITSKVTSDGTVWKLYAELINGKNDLTQEDRVKALQYLQKCHRCETQSIGWEKEVDKCKHVTEQCLNISAAYVKYCDNITEPTQLIQHLSSAKLMVKGVLSKIKMAHTDPVTQVLSTDLQDSFNKLNTQLVTIEDLINKTKES